ncbi:MAG: hypothetical protein HDR00_06650 [Lachnospiraceae bacterium]|nr:hypothetical protein [Lachnospiraceae bacterium]
MNHNDAAKDEESFIEIPVKTKYILCFPPREMLAGNFFSQAKRIVFWKPCARYRYGYETASVGEQEEVREMEGRIRIGDTVCIFMESAPETGKGDFFTKRWIDWKVKKYVRKMEEEETESEGDERVCDIYQMKHRQDYPYSLRLRLAEDFLEKLDFGKRTRIGIVEGDTLKRQDLIALIRGCYDKMNFLTIFSREGVQYRELVEDAWEQYGLAITVTASFGELAFCDYVLDCTRMPFEGNVRCRKGCFFFSLFGDQKKIRSLRKAGGEITFDSCANILDRAFHNKV